MSKNDLLGIRDTHTQACGRGMKHSRQASIPFATINSIKRTKALAFCDIPCSGYESGDRRIVQIDSEKEEFSFCNFFLAGDDDDVFSALAFWNLGL